MRVTRPAEGLAPTNRVAPETAPDKRVLFKEDCNCSSTGGLDQLMVTLKYTVTDSPGFNSPAV